MLHAIPPRGREDLQEFLVKHAVVRQDVRRAQVVRSAGHIRARATGFADEKDPRSHVPRAQADFPEPVEPAASNVREIDSRGTRAPYAMRAHCEFVEEVNVRIS